MNEMKFKFLESSEGALDLTIEQRYWFGVFLGDCTIDVDRFHYYKKRNDHELNYEGVYFAHRFASINSLADSWRMEKDDVSELINVLHATRWLVNCPSSCKCRTIDQVYKFVGNDSKDCYERVYHFVVNHKKIAAIHAVYEYLFDCNANMRGERAVALFEQLNKI